MKRGVMGSEEGPEKSETGLVSARNFHHPTGETRRSG